MSRRDTAPRLLSLDAAVATIAEWRARGSAVAVVRGAFDLLQAGHARQLTAARARADRLVVAVEDDGTVSRRLGAGRPVSRASERARVVAALRGVDAVTLVDEAGLSRLVAALGPGARAGTVSPELESELWSRLHDVGGPR